MSSIEKNFKSLIKTKDEKNTVDINLHTGDIVAIMECLHFAHTAAKVLSELELKSGSKGGTKKMMKMQRDSLELCHILADHLDIGNPNSNEIN